MKKLLMITLILLSSIFLSIPKVMSVSLQTVYLPQNWIPYNFYSFVNGMQYQASIPTGVDNITISFQPEGSYLPDDGGVDSEIILTHAGGYIYITLADLQIAGVFSPILESNVYIDFLSTDYLGTNMTAYTFTHIAINYVLDLNLDDCISRYPYYNEEFTVSFYGYYTMFRFYNGLTLIQTQEVTATNPLPTLPTDPTREGYTFMGWRTQTHEMLDTPLENIKPEWRDTNNTVWLYAVFQTTPEAYVPPTVNENAPTGLLTVLTAIGLGNDFGLLLLFLFIILGLTVFLLGIKAPLFAFTIVYALMTVLWLYLGYMALFVSVILLMANLVFMLVVIRSDKEGYNE